MRIEPPNAVSVPNEVFDRLAEFADREQLVVLLAVIRRTYGWYQTYPHITLALLMADTQLSREAVEAAVARLVADDWIEQLAGSQPVYALRREP